MPSGGRGHFEYTYLDPVTGTPKTIDLPSFTCKHCSSVYAISPNGKEVFDVEQRVVLRSEQKWCFNCDAYICSKSGCLANCNNMEQSVELALENPNRPVGFLGRDRDGNPLPGYDYYKERRKIY